MQAADAAYVEPDSRTNEGRGEIKQSSCFHWPVLLYGPYFKAFLFVLDTPEHCGKSSNGWQLTSSTGSLTPRVVLTQPPPLPATDHGGKPLQRSDVRLDGSIAPLLVMAVFTGLTVKDADLPLVFSGILGIYLLICAYGAIGLFMSSITSYQVVAAMGTLAVLAALNYVGEVGQDYAFVRDITYWLSISGRAYQFIDGLICTEDVLYFLIVIVLFISLSILKLRAGRSKVSRARSWGTSTSTETATSRIWWPWWCPARSICALRCGSAEWKRWRDGASRSSARTPM